MKATETIPQKSVAEVEREIADVVENGMLLNADQPTENVAEWLLKNTSADLLYEWSRILLVRNFAAQIARIRLALRKADRLRQLELTFHFPELREQIKLLPARFRNADTTRGDLAAFVKERKLKIREKGDADPALQAAEQILKAWPKRPGSSRSFRKMALGEVDAMKAKRARLI